MILMQIGLDVQMIDRTTLGIVVFLDRCLKEGRSNQ